MWRFDAGKLGAFAMTIQICQPLFRLAVCISTLVIAGGNAALADTPNPLAKAIQEFNQKSLADAIGKDQPPLSEAEVVAAIRLSEKATFAEASDSLFQTFKEIAATRQLPPGASIEVLTRIDLGGEFIFDVWYVRLSLPRPDGGTYSFAIRRQVVGSKSVAVVARELELKLKQVKPAPGVYRIEERLKDLKERAAAIESGKRLDSPSIER